MPNGVTTGGGGLVHERGTVGQLDTRPTAPVRLLVLGYFDFDAARAGDLLLGQRDLQHAICEGRGHLLRVHAFGQREGAGVGG